MADPTSFVVPPIPVPKIDRYGITVPVFDDILEWVRTVFRTIYGADIYIEDDSQDGQLIGIFSKALHDYASVSEATYNAFSPSSAQGEGLSRVVKINGIRRRIPTRSTADVRIVGVPGTLIAAGTAQDVNGNLWDLPPNVVIPSAAELVVTVTARDLGEIYAPAHTITNFIFPVKGWQSVDNDEPALPGAPVELDSALRVRQSISTSIPAHSVFDGLLGAVASVPGVLRFRGYQNEDWGESANGLPGRSITVVADGGDPAAIADVIRRMKSPGTVTYGTTVQAVNDEYGIPHNIWFSRSRQVPIRIMIPIRPLPRFTTVVGSSIRAAVVDYINALPIGDDVILSDVISKATLGDDPRFDVIRPVTIARQSDGVFVEGDLVLEYDERAILTPSDITLTNLTGELG